VVIRWMRRSWRSDAKSLQMSHKPVLFVDIDGVISLFGFAMDECPPGGWHVVDGISHFLSAQAGQHLQALHEHFELVWCSGWEEKANEYLPALLDLPRDLPFVTFEPDPDATRLHWKLDAVEAFAGERPLAWIDDTFNDACHAWARERAAPTLLVATAPPTGLTAADVETLVAWAAGLADGPATGDEAREAGGEG